MLSAFSPVPAKATASASRPSAAWVLSSSVCDSSSEASFIGFTRPEVPRIEMPPTIPSRGLKVRFATSAPCGAEMVTSAPRAPITSRSARSIIMRGTGLIAGSPMETLSPGRVTVPTPSPARKLTAPGTGESFTAALIMMPSVESGSSPASFITPQLPSSYPTTGSVKILSSGVVISTLAGQGDPSARSAAAFAAAAAQLPVEYPSRSSLFDAIEQRVHDRGGDRRSALAPHGGYIGHLRREKALL